VSEEEEGDEEEEEEEEIVNDNGKKLVEDKEAKKKAKKKSAKRTSQTKSNRGVILTTKDADTPKVSRNNQGDKQKVEKDDDDDDDEDSLLGEKDIYKAPVDIRAIIQDPEKIEDHPCFTEWLEEQNFGFCSEKGVPDICSNVLKDVVLGHCLVHFVHKVEITADILDSDGVLIKSTPPDHTEVREEWSSLVEDDDDDLDWDANLVSPIYTGFDHSKINIQLQDDAYVTSRFSLKQSTVNAKPTEFPNLVLVFPAIQTKLQNLLNESMGWNKEGEPPYTLVDGAVIWDTRKHPHVQAPKYDFDQEKVKKIAKVEKPMTCLYGIDQFSIILYHRKGDIFGANVGTRIVIPKGSCIFLLYSVLNSADYYIAAGDDNDDDSSRNAYVRFYCIPSTWKKQPKTKTLNEYCIISDNGTILLTRTLDGNHRYPVTLINTFNYRYLGDEFDVIKKLMKSMCGPKGSTFQYGKDYAMLIKLYDFLAFAKNESLDVEYEKKSEGETSWGQDDFLSEMVTYHEIYLQAILSLIYTYHKNDKDEINVYIVDSKDGSKVSFAQYGD
jgi:hypothetical protein